MIDVCLYSAQTMGFQIDRNGKGEAVSLTVRSIKPNYDMETVRIFMDPQQMRDMRDVLDSALASSESTVNVVVREAQAKVDRAEIVKAMHTMPSAIAGRFE